MPKEVFGHGKGRVKSIPKADWGIGNRVSQIVRSDRSRRQDKVVLEAKSFFSPSLIHSLLFFFARFYDVNII